MSQLECSFKKPKSEYVILLPKTLWQSSMYLNKTQGHEALPDLHLSDFTPLATLQPRPPFLSSSKHAKVVPTLGSLDSACISLAQIFTGLVVQVGVLCREGKREPCEANRLASLTWQVWRWWLLVVFGACL